jgi:hypothetical protein
MHKNQSVAKESGEVIDSEQTSVRGDSRRRDAVKIDSRPTEDVSPDESNSRKVDPTRYGDWERNGRCIDF